MVQTAAMQRTVQFEIDEGPVPGFVVPMDHYVFWSQETSVDYGIKKGYKALFLFLGLLPKKEAGSPAEMLRYLGWVPFREKEELEERVRVLERELRRLKGL